MIKRGHAYVCHQPVEEVYNWIVLTKHITTYTVQHYLILLQLKGFEARVHSPWRDRPIEESLRLFEDMRSVSHAMVYCDMKAFYKCIFGFVALLLACIVVVHGHACICCTFHTLTLT